MPFTTDELAGVLWVLAGGTPQPAHERIATALQRALTLRIFPEDRLPSERWLADAFGVSRITIRGALAFLREQGMVRSGGSRRAGTVSNPRTTDAHGNPARLLEDAGRDIADILDFRSLVEPVAARLAARFADDELVTRLRLSVDGLRTSPDPTAFRRADSAFHLALARATRNQRLLEAVLVTRAELLAWRDLIPMPDDVAENLVEHERIADAVEARDEDRAAAEMLAHLRGTLTSFELHVQALGANEAVTGR